MNDLFQADSREVVKCVVRGGYDQVKLAKRAQWVILLLQCSFHATQCSFRVAAFINLTRVKLVNIVT